MGIRISFYSIFNVWWSLFLAIFVMPIIPILMGLDVLPCSINWMANGILLRYVCYDNYIEFNGVFGGYCIRLFFVAGFLFFTPIYRILNSIKCFYCIGIYPILVLLICANFILFPFLFELFNTANYLSHFLNLIL